MIVPPWSWVCALNALQNSMMFTPCWPSAGPTGGAGLAAPPGTWSLMSVRTFLAMSRVRLPGLNRQRAVLSDLRGRPHQAAICLLDLLHLVEADLDRRLAAEDGY